MLPGVMPIVVGRTREEAKALWEEKLKTLVDMDHGLKPLSLRFGLDLSTYPLGEGNQSRAKLMTDMAKRESLVLPTA